MWAFVIDALLALSVSTPAVIGAVLLARGDASWGPITLLVAGLIATVILTAVQLVLHGMRGVTAGKASMRLRSVSVIDLGRPGFWRIVLRALVLAASGVVPVVGPAILLCSSLWDAEGRGRSILDRLARCWLLDVRAGLDPADAAALRRARRELEAPEREVSENLPSLATGSEGARPVFADRRSRAAIIGVSGGPWRESARVPVAAPAPPSVPGIDPAPVGAPPASAPTSAPPVAEVPRAAHHLVFEDGSTVAVPTLGLIGRMPEAGPTQRADLVLSLEDPQRLMSKTHLAFGLDTTGVWVCDQGSSNGTVVLGADGTETAIPAGDRVSLASGTVVRIGGRMFQVRDGGVAP